MQLTIRVVNVLNQLQHITLAYYLGTYALKTHHLEIIKSLQPLVLIALLVHCYREILFHQLRVWLAQDHVNDPWVQVLALLGLLGLSARLAIRVFDTPSKKRLHVRLSVEAEMRKWSFGKEKMI